MSVFENVCLIKISFSIYQFLVVVLARVQPGFSLIDAEKSVGSISFFNL